MDEYSLRDIYLEIELHLLKSLKRNLTRWHNETQSKGFTWEPWQMTKLRHIAQFRKDNRAIVGYYDKKIEEIIDNVIRGQFLGPQSNELQGPSSILDDMFPHDQHTPLDQIPSPEQYFFHTNDKKVEVLIEELKDNARKVNQMVINKMNGDISLVMTKAHHFLDQGAMTIQQATDLATKDLFTKGINAITYKNGSRRSISSHAEMALRTAVMRTKFLADGKDRDLSGNHLVITSIHANCCPACLRWQGEILIDDVFSNGTRKDGYYWMLSKAMEHGFLHPNCRHDLVTYRPGITRKPTPLTFEQERQANKSYKAEQIQRKLERKIREQKREIEVRFDNSKNKEKLKMLQSALRSHIKLNPELRRNYWRERIV